MKKKKKNTLKQLIFKYLIKQGKFVYINPDIVEEHFPITEPPSSAQKILTVSGKDIGGILNRTYKINEIEASIVREGYRSATLPELLIFSKKWNGKDTVFALGSSWGEESYRLIPYLFSDRGARNLNLICTGPHTRWLADEQFLVVKKK